MPRLSWCVGFYRRRISDALPVLDDEDGTPDFAGIRAAVAAWLRAHLREEKFYNFAMVDEGQDLDGAAFAILTAVAGHVTVGMDVKQQIYGGGSDEGEVLRGLGLRRKNVTLLEVFRCCPYIAELASQFVAITRAQGWAYLSTAADGKAVFAPLERLLRRAKGHN